MKRIVSIWLPHWPTDRLALSKCQRQTAGAPAKGSVKQADSPFALTYASGAGNKGGNRLYAVNPVAAAAGLTGGMKLADSRVLVPALLTQKAAPAADLKALKRLARWAVRYTPWVNIDGTDGLILDISGCGHLFGDEEALLADISAKLRGFGLNHRLAVAPTRGAAWALARYEKTLARYGPPSPSDVVTSLEAIDSVKKGLGPYPVEALRIGSDVAQTLRRLGLKTIAQLEAIPRIALKRRFPSHDLVDAVLLRLDQALGEVGEPVSPLTPAPAFRTRAAFPEPVTNPASIERSLDGLLHDLVAVLEVESMGARRLSLTAWCVDSSVSSIELGISHPSRDAAHLSFLFKNKLEQLDIKDGIELLILSAEGVEALPRQQLSTLSAGTREKAAAVPVSRLVDRLSSRLGRQAVRRSVLRESHIPERAESRPAILDMVPATARKRQGHPQYILGPTAPLRPIRLFERPEPLEVIAEIPDGPPLRFRWRRMSVRVALAEGPERISPEWWHHMAGKASKEAASFRDMTPDTRDYYRLEDDMGRRFWVYRAGLYQIPACSPPVASVAPEDVLPAPSLPRWFMHGLFS